jgi:hypothetical protein
LFARVPWSLPVAALAAVPIRVPVSIGPVEAHLLLPLYVLVAGATLTFAGQLVRGDRRARELGLVAWPLALLVAWTGLSLVWTADPRRGGILILFYVLPLGLLAATVARLPWRPGWVGLLGVELVAMGAAFAVVGAWQYLTRDLSWAPRSIGDHARLPSSWLFRVDSVFTEPATYGRFLAVAALVALAAALFARGLAWTSWVAAAAVVVIWLGLVPSFSQSSFVALGVGALSALVALWWSRGVVVIAAVAVVIAAGAFVATAASSGFPDAVDRQSDVVSTGVRVALDHPFAGVGVGGFTARDVSSDAPVTIAAETGVVGFALFVWLALAALVMSVRRLDTTQLGRMRLALGLGLLAIVVHSLLAGALFEEPLFWGLLGLCAVGAREAAA